MGDEGIPQTPRRTTRASLSSTVNPKNSTGKLKSCNLLPLTIHDLAYGDESISLDDLISSLPGRRAQIIELLHLLGTLDSPMFPVFVYGGASTGKTSSILQIFKHLKRPFVYCSCITCYSPRILFESVLNQLLLHRRNESNRYSSTKRCERPSDFVNLLQEALHNVLDSLTGNVEKSSSKKSVGRARGKMVYLVFDNLELAREWDKSSNILPFLFKLYDILKMPEVGLIFLGNASPDTYYSDTGYVEPVPVYFPDYTDDELHQILMKNQKNPKLYSSFLEVVLRPFCRVTRRVDELSTAFSSLYQIYCEPLDDLGIVLSEDMKRKLFSHLQPHIGPYLNNTFKVESRLSSEASAKTNKWKGIAKKIGVCESSSEIDFHMSVCAKYLLICAFLASRNPATLDASLFDSTGGSSNQKRKRKSSEKSKEKKEIVEQELLLKGPGTFPLERLLAICQCVVSVSECLPDEEAEGHDGLEGESWTNGLLSDALLELSSLCNANFISKAGTCPLEGANRYRSMVSEAMALKVAKSLKFPLAKYLYRGG
ncbi:origin of replication complex subunit 5-like [Solanum dulcamara]|uniref:origin of replication complex subunit 5-like n=1 Tax=Solanum dulcamara TaxID=45834 RepID=UPI002485B6A4|nr:origin of replication complex subunit 5-like [Solanum dulcamara]XP_055819909.1 origin of replication complex subunit 5-like [Solanum dulcamara]XP_055819910.1 origin of replication complex subunit 5-like [Solanum dulcamara]XP_055819911.1 origin of replication complex subunit 5-like [Solanum dulcamara]XP_055819912.1 origin of replication complex subunit 5-like [Solanum dulcamara]